MTFSNRRVRRPRRLPAFTLIELLIATSIVVILASATLFALYGVVDDAKEARTRSQIVRIHDMLISRWDGYQTRSVPIVLPAGVAPRPAAWLKVQATRELMRVELPDRKSDVVDDPVIIPAGNSLQRAYRRQAIASMRAHVHPAALPNPWHTSWTPQNQGAECLYLIVSSFQDGDSVGLDFFRESEIDDVDDDGMNEIVDGWGKPIDFLRWAPGFLDDSDIQVRDSDVAPDPFDPFKVDPIWTPGDGDPTNDPFALYPLIFSAGRDGLYDVSTDYDTDPSTAVPANAPIPINDPNFDHYRAIIGARKNDPYHTATPNLPTGFGAVGGNGSIDNITNHLFTAQ